jgi:hypothetical protein
MSYDLIGDIHGCADTLRALLDELGYKRRQGVYEHLHRRVIFLGDFVDRGPKQRETLELVRPMIEQGTARSVMGNHEFNAVSFATPKRGGEDFLRTRNRKHIDQHQAFLDEYAEDPDAWAEVIDWFRTLPLWLEVDGMRVVHAVWCPDTIKRLASEHDDRALLSDDFLYASGEKGTWQFDAIELILKGQEVELPPSVEYFDKDGNRRSAMRARWWDDTAETYREAYLGPPEYQDTLPEDPLPDRLPLAYGTDEPPVFIGHYWQTGRPEPLAPNVACLDYSVGKHGSLVAYRWDGEQELSADKYVAMERLDP